MITTYSAETLCKFNDLLEEYNLDRAESNIPQGIGLTLRENEAIVVHADMTNMPEFEYIVVTETMMEEAIAENDRTIALFEDDHYEGVPFDLYKFITK